MKYPRLSECLLYLGIFLLVLLLLSLGAIGKILVLVLGVIAIGLTGYYHYQLMRLPWDEWDEVAQKVEENSKETVKPMKFEMAYCSPEFRFSIGRELESGGYYLAIPVSNRLVDYEEYYALSSEQYAAYPENMALLREFAQRCQTRQCDDLLLIQPGSDRGVA